MTYETNSTIKNLFIDKDLIDNILKEKKSGKGGKKFKAGWQSIFYHNQPFPWFQTTVDALMEKFPGYKLDTWWFNVTEKNESFPWHHHFPWPVCAVLYVSMSDKGGEIVFKDDKGNEWEETPEVGDLVIFPGKLWHSVKPNLSDTTRISIALNFKKV